MSPRACFRLTDPVSAGYTSEEKVDEKTLRQKHVPFWCFDQKTGEVLVTPAGSGQLFQTTVGLDDIFFRKDLFDPF